MPKNQVFRMFRFFTLRNKRRDFQNLHDFYLYPPRYLGISYSIICNLIYYLSLKCHFLEKFYVKLAYLEQEQIYQPKSYYLECSDGFRRSCNAIEV